MRDKNSMVPGICIWQSCKPCCRSGHLVSAGASHAFANRSRCWTLLVRVELYKALMLDQHTLPTLMFLCEHRLTDLLSELVPQVWHRQVRSLFIC